MTNRTKTFFVNRLARSICFFTYTKKDGTTRTVRATLQSSYLPPITGKARELPKHYITLFDLDAGQWRTLRTQGIRDFAWLEKEVY